MNHPESAPWKVFKLCAVFFSICKQMCILLRREDLQILSHSSRSCKPKEFKDNHPKGGIINVNGKVPFKVISTQADQC